MPVTAVYAGSFDPPTNGHVWVIRAAGALFPRLVVAIGTNPDKRYAYPLERRVGWLRGITGDLPGIEVACFDNLFLGRFAQSIGAAVIVRGIRNESDYAYERAMRHVNADLAPRITTVFLIPPRELGEVSSSMIKGMIGPEGWRDIVRQYVPPAVFEDLSASHA